MGRRTGGAQQVSRPRRRATNAHIFRYLQTRNPSRLEESDLKRALEASLEHCPDAWPDSASSTSSEQSNGTTATTTTNSRSTSSPANSQLNHAGEHRTVTNTTSTTKLANVHRRFRPVARKNIYHEADFFHDGIMEYIEYQLSNRLSWPASSKLRRQPAC